MIATGPTASVAVAATKLTAAPLDIVASATRFALQLVITGAVVSRTVIVNVVLA